MKPADWDRMPWHAQQAWKTRQVKRRRLLAVLEVEARAVHQAALLHRFEARPRDFVPVHRRAATLTADDIRYLAEQILQALPAEDPTTTKARREELVAASTPQKRDAAA